MGSFIDENNKLKRELAETKTILVSHQNDSIRRMQESRRMKSIILTLWAPRGPYMDPKEITS